MMNIQAMRSRLAPLVIDVAVFVSGAVVMIYEIVGSRVVAPFIGTSTYVWTSLIGVILGSLSLGYWYGGRLADRRPDARVLAFVLLLAGGAVSLTILVKDVVASIVGGLPVPIEAKAVLVAILLFAPASVCFGFVTPYAARLRLTGISDSGRTVGRLYALSTVGSILGTFAAGFVLVPFVGSTRTLYLIAAAVFAIALSLAPIKVTQTSVGTLLLFVLSLAASEAASWSLARSAGLVDVDTEYSRVRIFTTADPATGRPIRALATDPYITQSAVFLDSDELVLPHNRFYHLVRHYTPDFTNALMIGGAGYTFPREFLRSYPSATIDVVEIDPRMTELARMHFRLRDDPRMRIYHEDGRTFLNNAPDAGYDAVLIDAFGSLFSIPPHLTTREAVAEIRRVLRPGGVVILNLGSAIEGPGSEFLGAELATYLSVFSTVELFQVHPDYPSGRLQNLIVAARKDGGRPAPAPDELIDQLLSHRRHLPAVDIAPLTDEVAPVEYYNAIALDEYLRIR
ncbi:MAG: fused MFS/spermidine synthase [Pyrinomonadaceae bacterium]